MIDIKNSDIEVGVHSSTGRLPFAHGRPRLNLDRYCVKSFQNLFKPDSITTLALIADTLGSYSGYEDWDDTYPPSQMVLEHVIQMFGEKPQSDVVKTLSHTLESASDLLRTKEHASATCVAVVVDNNQLYAASCGDCRAFLLREHEAQQITVAHRIPERLIELGEVTVEHLLNYPYRDPGPYRILGIDGDSGVPDLHLYTLQNREASISYQGFALLPGDQIVLTSGSIFCGFLTPDDWIHLKRVFFDKHLSIQEAADHLVKPIREGNDVSDMTVVALKLVSDS